MNSKIAQFSRSISLLGFEKFNKLQDAHVCIIGIGGVGSWCAESLVRTGIGHIHIIDNDYVTIHNVNRQVIALNSTINQSKVEILSNRLLDINPSLNIKYSKIFVDQSNIESLLPLNLAKKVWVVDAIDSVNSKLCVINYLVKNGFYFISSGGVGGKMNPMNIKISDLSKVTNDPLLRNIRNELRRKYNFLKNSKSKMGIKCVFVDEPISHAKDVLSQEDIFQIENCCNGDYPSFGSFMHVTASVGINISYQIINSIIVS